MGQLKSFKTDRQNKERKKETKKERKNKTMQDHESTEIFSDG